MEADAIKLQELKALIHNKVASGELPMLGIVIKRKGRVVMNEHAGSGLGPDTILRFFSMAKPICAVAALLLVEDGRLKLEADLSSVLPYWDDSKVNPKSCRITHLRFVA